MSGRTRWPLTRVVRRPQAPTRPAWRLQSSRARWRPARVVTRRQAATSYRLAHGSLGDLDFDFISGWRGLGDFPDDLKPPIVTGLNAVLDRRCGALTDHCLGGTLGVLPECETRSSAVHRFLLLKTTTHTLLSAAQSTVSRGLTLCQCTVNIDLLGVKACLTAITPGNYSRSP